MNKSRFLSTDIDRAFNYIDIEKELKEKEKYGNMRSINNIKQYELLNDSESSRDIKKFLKSKDTRTNNDDVIKQFEKLKNNIIDNIIDTNISIDNNISNDDDNYNNYNIEKLKSIETRLDKNSVKNIDEINNNRDKLIKDAVKNFDMNNDNIDKFIHPFKYIIDTDIDSYCDIID